MGFEIGYANKPEGWPANAIEVQLENIMIQVENFIANPNYKNKEILVSLVSNYDLNQSSALGLYRTTDYEVSYINSLYVYASSMSFNGLKAYLYDLVGKKTRMQKITSWMPQINESANIESFQYLLPELMLYYFSYQRFTINKDNSYSEQLISVVEELIGQSKVDSNEEEYYDTLERITQAYLTLLNDISYFRCKRINRIWAFNREELTKLFTLAAKLVSLTREDPTKRPLKGVLMTCISNYILKSRNNYNEDYICKYISPEVAKKSVENHEIWMADIKKLNDEREQRVVEELFDEDDWKKYTWVQNLDFTATRKYYVSSFCKKLNDKHMSKNYGSCLYGYKDDRMAELLAPTIYWKTSGGKVMPMFAQVITFDVIYDRNEAKEELSFLCDVINLFNINEKEKRLFLQEILQYWILSVKDPTWEQERERRYVLFMYDDYEYGEVDLTDPDFFKLKTTLFIEPDFILGDNPVKTHLRAMIDDKRTAISTKRYMFCRNCLNRDFDIITGLNAVEKCPICGSKNISIEGPDR